MILNLVIDHRFFRDGDGVVFSPQHWNYRLFEMRYLKVFQAVRVFARVSDGASPRPRGGDHAEGPRVSIISLGDWTGPGELASKFVAVDRRLRSELRRGDAHMLIAPGQLTSLAARHLRRSSAPYGVELVGDPAHSFDGRLKPVAVVLRWAWPRDLRKLVAGAAAVSYVTRTTLQERYPPGPHAFATHYSSIELPDGAFAESSRVYKEAPAPARLVTVAALANPYKGVHVLISALADCRTRGFDISLTVVGDGRLRPSLEAHAVAEGVADAVTFRGQVAPGPPVWDELDRADLFVLASTTEGLPRVVIEAMARGLPCVATAVGGVPELLPEDALVPPSSPAALADGLIRALQAPEWLSTASARNMIAARDYSAEVLMPRRLAMYRHLRAASER
jgi:glycosyltransferase involved in cell wall biosynthesis